MLESTVDATAGQQQQQQQQHQETYGRYTHGIEEKFGPSPRPSFGSDSSSSASVFLQQQQHRQRRQLKQAACGCVIGRGTCTNAKCSKLMAVSFGAGAGVVASTATFVPDDSDDTDSNLVMTRKDSSTCTQVYAVTSGTILGQTPGVIPTGGDDTVHGLIVLGVVMAVVLAGGLVIGVSNGKVKCFGRRAEQAVMDFVDSHERSGSGRVGNARSSGGGGGSRKYGTTARGARPLMNSDAGGDSDDDEPIFGTFTRRSSNKSTDDPLTAAVKRREAFAAAARSKKPATAANRSSGIGGGGSGRKRGPKKAGSSKEGVYSSLFDLSDEEDNGIDGGGAEADDQTTVVILERATQAAGLGFVIRTIRREGTFVTAVQPGSIADGKLRLGDKIVSVNNVPLATIASHAATVALITPLTRMVFRVIRVVQPGLGAKGFGPSPSVPSRSYMDVAPTPLPTPSPVVAAPARGYATPVIPSSSGSTSAALPPAAAEKACRQCGTINPAGNSFCKECGSRQ